MGISESMVVLPIETAEIIETYETVSKNLKGIPFSLNYSSGLLASVIYSNGITKTFIRTGSKITSIVLSGSTPSGIALTKVLGYTGDNLTSVGYL